MREKKLGALELQFAEILNAFCSMSRCILNDMIHLEGFGFYPAVH